VAEDQAKFAVVLEDKTSGAAASAAEALEKLRGSIKRDTQELAAMQSAMKRMQSGTSVNVEAFRELQGRIEAQKNKIAEAESKFVTLGGRFGTTAKGAKAAADKTKSLGETMGKLPGPLGRVGGGLSGLVGQFGSVKMGALAVVAAIVAVGVAALAAGAKLAAFGLESGNARRSQELHFEAISRMRRGLMGMRASSGEVMGAIDQVAGSTATSREQVARFAEILQRGGVRGANLTTALRAAATKAAALGDDAGAAFAQMAVGASRSGASIDRLADDVQARFGGVAARKLLDLGVLTTKLKENWDALFDGLNLEPLLGMFREVVGFFSQSTATGRALKAIITALFQPLIDSAGEGTPIVKRFFQGIVIAALQVTIVLLRVRNFFRNAFDGTVVSRISMMKVALYAGALAFGAFAVAALAGIAIIVSAIAVLTAPFVFIGVAIYATVRAMRALWNAGRDVAAGFVNIGGQLVTGLINGIRNGIGRAKEAVRELGRGAISTLREVLDIHSPSRVFAQLGRQIPAGVSVGVDSGAEGANASVANMVDVPGSLGGGGARGAVSISIGDVHVNGGNSAEIAENLRDELARVLEGLALTMGGARV
jgi:hypothetical protein